jgi:hypothetical membrane protein
MQPSLRRAGTYLGVAALAVSVLGIAVAIALAPWFSPAGNALSDLGASGRASAPAFNYGLILGGILGTGFAVRLWPDAPGRLGRAGVGLLGVSFGSLALIGVFPTPHEYHFPVSVTFFTLFTYGLFVYGSADALAGRLRAGIGTVWLGIAHVTFWVGWAAAGTDGLAIPETVGAVLLGVWVVVTTRRLREAGNA